jgi:glycosyltransferase involved in cell wall biosynthesis
MARQLILFTSLPKVGGHSPLTEGLCRLLRPAFDHIEIWCKPMPGHGHSKAMAARLEGMGCSVRMLAGENGRLHVMELVNAIRQARLRRKETVFFTLAMRHLSVVLAATLNPAQSIYYHITHDLNARTIRRLRWYARFFRRLVFICPATYHEFPGAEMNPAFSWAPQSSEMQIPNPQEILACKAARSGGPLRLGLLGRLTPDKGSLVMLDFINRVQVPCELHVAGSGPCAAEFSDRASKHASSPGRVVFHGSYDPAERSGFLRKFFSGIDLLVVPSQDEWETLSMVTLEALQHGTPSLLCRTGGLVSFGLPDLGPAPESVVGLVNPDQFERELTRRLTAPRTNPIGNLETSVGRLRDAQEAEVQADCGISSCTSSVLRADDASRIKPASCADRPEPTDVSRGNGQACLDYYAQYFRDSAIQQRWLELLNCPP